ncbi:MAG: type III polyketide synthase [Candidatus Methylacidiphilales bacterium]
MGFINKIGTATAPYKMLQKEVSSYMQNFYEIPFEEKRKIALMYERCGIETRYSAVPDYHQSLQENLLLPNNLQEPFPSIDKRMELFFKVAPPMCIDAVNNCLNNKDELKKITHLITISCTGMAAPGLDLILMEQLNLSNNTHRTSVNFMGCYAVFHALKMANAFCAENENHQVLVVSVELCTLHFQNKFTMDNIAANLLFADGAAAAIITSKPRHQHAIELNSFYSQVVLNGKADMAWHLSETGFLMTLSAFIPDLIKSGIGNLLNGVLAQAQLTKNDINNWAIHPGGRKIIETIKAELGLSLNDVAASFNVLKNYGNMSSATILFVLAQMQLEERKGKVFACGFGPGLTLETLIGDFI